MRKLFLVGALAVAWLAWSGVGAQVNRTPTPGTGIVPITGIVEVANRPTVNAVQNGDWNVRLADTASVAVAGPEFLKTGTTYEVVWPNGDLELVRVQQVGRDGWVRVARKDVQRWINVAAARSLEARP